MARLLAVLAALALVCPMVSAGPCDGAPRRAAAINFQQPAAPPSGIYTIPPDQRRIAPVPIPIIHLSAYQPEPEIPAAPLSALSPAATRVGLIAIQHGDRNFLIIDKVHGLLIVFVNRVPVFTGAALTGLSLADHLPPDATRKTNAATLGPNYRVTPAGRFTLSPGWDDAYGRTLDINEIQGPDWSIAIHAVPMGPRSGHREALLRSPLDQDKHVTEGCVNVDASTMRVLSRLLPRPGGTPIYILPNDESLITTLFLGTRTASFP